MQFQNIEKFNHLWSIGEIATSIVLAIGGYAGTGKSLTTNSIIQHLKYVNILPSGIIRSIEQKFTKREENPSMFESTYNLHKFTQNNTDEEVIEQFLNQAIPICETINYSINFASTEKQHFAIDGNHILPKYLNNHPDVILIEFYNKVSNPDIHKMMLEGPTHNRTLDEQQFATARILHDYLINEAYAYGKNVFEFDESPFKALGLVDKKLGEYLTNLNLTISNL